LTQLTHTAAPLRPTKNERLVAPAQDAESKGTNWCNSRG